MILDPDAPVVTHGINDLAQLVVSAGDAFQQDPVLQACIPLQHIAHAQGGEHPVLDAVLTEHLLILYIIPIPVLAVTLNNHAKDIQD